MEESDHEEVDTRLGDIMGFTTFGAKSDAKKRKTSHGDDPVTATSSNAIPLGQHATQYGQTLTHNPAQQPQAIGGVSSASPTAEQPRNAFPTGVPMDIFNKLTWKELEAYRKGVKKDNGDLAWFLPSFIEDPWAKLEKSGGGKSTQ